MSLLVIHKILWLFVNTLTTDDKYSLFNRDNLAEPLRMQLCKKEIKNGLSQFLTAFLESRSNSKHFEKQMTLRGYVFPILQTAKDEVRQVSENSRFRRTFDKQHVQWCQTLSKSSQQNLQHTCWSIWTKFSRKCLLVIHKILWLFVNTLSDDDKYSLFNRDNLAEPLQMQLSKKEEKKSSFSIFDCIFGI